MRCSDCFLKSYWLLVVIGYREVLTLQETAVRFSKRIPSLFSYSFLPQNIHNNFTRIGNSYSFSYSVTKNQSPFSSYCISHIWICFKLLTVFLTTWLPYFPKTFGFTFFFCVGHTTWAPPRGPRILVLDIVTVFSHFQDNCSLDIVTSFIKGPLYSHTFTLSYSDTFMHFFTLTTCAFAYLLIEIKYFTHPLHAGTKCVQAQEQTAPNNLLDV